MDHIERIQECRFRLWSGFNIIPKLLSRATRLQHLEINRVSYLTEQSFVLFDGDAPSLRTLKLTCCPVPLHSFKQLRGLTMLHLCRVPVRCQQNTAAFLATLGYMQGLTHLYLDNALTSAAYFLSSAAFHSFQKFNLPHLSRLWIAAPLSVVTALLSCVNIPLKTQVRLEVGVEDGSSSLHNYAPLCSLLTQRFRIIEDQALQPDDSFVGYRIQ